MRLLRWPGPMAVKRSDRAALVARANRYIPVERRLNARQWQRAIFVLRQRGEAS